MTREAPRPAHQSWVAAFVLFAVLAALGAAAGIAGTGGSHSTVDAARATAKFHQLAVAKKSGYGLLQDKNGVACIAMDDMPGMGAMGVHYAKNALVADGALTPRGRRRSSTRPNAARFASPRSSTSSSRRRGTPSTPRRRRCSAIRST